MPAGSVAFSPSGFAPGTPGGGAGSGAPIGPGDVAPGDFQMGTYNFPGTLEVAGQPIVVAGAVTAADIGPGQFQHGVYDIPDVGGLTINGVAVKTTITAADVQPASFPVGTYNFPGTLLTKGAPVYYFGQGQNAGVVGTDIALDTVIGGTTAGVGNIQGSSIWGYNIHPGSLDYSLLSGVAQAQVLAFTTQDTSFTFLRRVSQTGALLDANGNETDGLALANGSTRVADPQAYGGYAITNLGVATGVAATGGPAYTGLGAGQYVATVFVRASAVSSSANVLSIQVTGTSIAANPVITVKGTDLSTGYIGIAVPFTVTSSSNQVNVVLTNLISSATVQWWFSHVHTDPVNGLTTQMASTYFFANAAITSAQIQSITANQITSGQINTDNIFLGNAGHIYAGTLVQSPTGNTARTELNAQGFFGYDGTKQTFSLSNTGVTAVAGTIGGWTIGPTQLTGSEITLDSVAETITIQQSPNALIQATVENFTPYGGVTSQPLPALLFRTPKMFSQSGTTADGYIAAFDNGTTPPNSYGSMIVAAPGSDYSAYLSLQSGSGDRTVGSYVMLKASNQTDLAHGAQLALDGAFNKVYLYGTTMSFVCAVGGNINLSTSNTGIGTSSIPTGIGGSSISLQATTTALAIAPASPATYDFGSIGARWATVWANTVNVNSLLTTASHTPLITSTYDLGSSSLRWNNLFVANIGATGNVSFTNGASVSGANFTSWSHIPASGSTYDLGSSGVRWNNLFVVNIGATGAATFTGGLSVTAGTASLATTGLVDISGGTGVKCTTFGSTTGTTLVINSNNLIGKLSSAKKYKQDITADDMVDHTVLNLAPVKFRYKDEVIAMGDRAHRNIGLIAEDVDTVMPDLVVKDAAGFPDAVMYDRIAVLLVPIVRDLLDRIDKLEKRGKAA